MRTRKRRSGLKARSAQLSCLVRRQAVGSRGQLPWYPGFLGLFFCAGRGARAVPCHVLLLSFTLAHPGHFLTLVQKESCKATRLTVGHQQCI